MTNQTYPSPFIGQYFGNSGTQAADNVVLFDRDQNLRPVSSAQNRITVDRLDGCHVDDTNGFAFFLQGCRRFQRT
ncbi:hypothetical protein D3C72_2370290 [compost metagenome]